MVALLTIFSKFSDKNMLLIGCDYPFLNAGELNRFSTFCKYDAIAFYNTKIGIYEPILAWYPNSFYQKILAMHKAKQYSLQHILTQIKAAKYLPDDEICIRSIDSIETYNETLKIINSG